MADSGRLMELTADIAPVTDNYPSRISSRAVGNPSYVELYDTLMDERQRLESFRSSELISQLWPAELRENSEAYFQYERMIKNHFTGGIYRQQTDPFAWEAIDDVLTNTSLTTLPLWLLGSDQDVQDIVAGLLERDGFRDDFALELARKHAADRDYASALRYMIYHISASDDVSEWASSFYLYLMARNGLVAQAKPIIANLEALGRPRMDRFLDWYTTRFEIKSADSSEPPSPGNQQVSETFE
jgi:hypothetical protein